MDRRLEGQTQLRAADDAPFLEREPGTLRITLKVHFHPMRLLQPEDSEIEALEERELADYARGGGGAIAFGPLGNALVILLCLIAALPWQAGRVVRRLLARRR